MTLREARDAYLNRNGYSLTMYEEPTFAVSLGPWTLRLPNPPERRRVIGAHDLHHVLSGYATDWIGEIEISAWEVRAGLGGSWVAWLICPSLALFGLLVCPRRVWRAWKSGNGVRSLLDRELDIDALLDMTVEDARRKLGIPAHGAARRPATSNGRQPAE